MSMLITGLGTAVPPHRISQSDAAEIAKQFSCETAAQERLFLTLYRRAGVDGRNCVVLDKSEGTLSERQSFYASSDPTTLDRMRKYEEQAGSLALAACQTALRDAAIEPDRITHLVTISCSGFFCRGSTSSWSSNCPCRPALPAPILGSWAARARSTACAWSGHFSKPIPRRVHSSRARALQPAPSVRLGCRQGRRQRTFRGRGRGGHRHERSIATAASLSGHRFRFDCGRELGKCDVLADRQSGV